MKLFANPFIKTVRINESQLRCLIREARDLDFSFDELEKLSPKDKIAYCDKHLGNSFSNGSSRRCYMLDDKFVLKLAYNEKGFAQNKFESGLIEKANSFILPVLDVKAKDYSFIVMEHVLPCSYEDFEKVLNTPFKNKWRQNSIKKEISPKKGDTKVGYNKYFDNIRGVEEEYEGMSALDVIWYIEDTYSLGNDGGYSVREIMEIERIIKNTPWFSELKRLASTYNLTDLSQMENYGLVKRNGKITLVILDCGLDKETFEKYYM